MAKSDWVILVLSASLLAAGLYNWHLNLEHARGARLSAAPSASATSPQDASARVLDNDGTSGAASALVTPLPSALVEVPANALGEPVTIAEAPAGTSQSLGSYRVVYGDYLGLIAQRFNTDIATLRELNGISGSVIQVGQEIRYPLPAN